jgi:ring-1,2-phenylacetyl-CoA epoxidase subunit PaaD
VVTTAYEAAASVVDPELRVVTIEQLGILRDVSVTDGRVRVTITPTYSGCPAMDVIRDDILAALRRAGYDDAEVVTSLRPAWSTDMISESGREALARNGIAPPGSHSCPSCSSGQVMEISRYGSTPCQALWRCHACREPFALVKKL